MDEAQKLLREKASGDSSNEHRYIEIADILQKLMDIGIDTPSAKLMIDDIIKRIKSLEHDGLWESTGKDKETLSLLLEYANSEKKAPIPHAKEKDIGQSSASSGISVVIPPASFTLLEGTPWSTAFSLPYELLEDLNRVYFLHLLATSPQDVLPEGKSLLSVMTRPNAQNVLNEEETPQLRTKVEEIVHKAFWDEAYESLSNPSPAKQLARLRGLYSDIHTSISSVIPPSHPIMATLTSPLSPTSAPLKSALRHFREVLWAMKERCAPIRDNEVDVLIQRADDATLGSPDALPSALIDITKFILEFSDIMKSDMAQFVMGRLSETELNAAMSFHAVESERTLIKEMWGIDYLQKSWKEWLEKPINEDPEMEHQVRWISRLLYCLGLNKAITCGFSHVSYEALEGHVNGDASTASEDANILPPPFLFLSPALLKSQNILQAIVATALLRVLISPPVPISASHIEGSDVLPFTRRVWSLLLNVIETNTATNDTKLVNLADEVIRERRRNGESQSSDSEVEDERIRKAVSRLLNANDPAFKLLQKRLLHSISRHLTVSASNSRAPRFMRTGVKRTRLTETPADDVTDDIQDFVPPKGFEDPVLIEEIKKIFHDLQISVRWIQDAWKGTLDGLS